MFKQKYTKSKNTPQDGLPLVTYDKLVDYLSEYEDSLVEDGFGWWLNLKFITNTTDTWWVRVDSNLLTMPHMPKYVRKNFDRMIEHWGECWLEVSY